MPTFKKATPDVRKLATELLNRFESHKPLLEARVVIDLVFAYCDRDEEKNLPLNDALTHHGAKALGVTRVLPLKDRVMGRGDAEICVDGDWWHETADEKMQAALLDHELHHVQMKTVKGQYQYDAAGRPKLKLRQHDVQVGWFALIAERHGASSIEQMQAKCIMDNAGQYFWPALAPNPQPKKLK